MIAHPEIQKRAQDELNAVVGRSRPPTFVDAPDLPFIQALVKESLRWRPVLSLVVPHRTIGMKGCSFPRGLFAW
jgi:cytochrome P450